MRHRPFPKIASADARTDRASPAGVWVASEKIHGAQLVIGASEDELRFGKRKEWLSENEPFFGWQLVRAELGESARAIRRETGAKIVLLYGELFGGAYPHPAVAAIPGLSAVQTGIWYSPDLRWAIFDVLVAASDGNAGELLAAREVAVLAAGSHLFTPPLLQTGTRGEVERLSPRFESRVAGALGLPAIAGNIAEGLVWKPDARADPGERVVWKRKIGEFDETRFDEASAFDAHARLSFEELASLALAMLNPARVASARSKVGDTDRGKLLDEIVLDVLVDLGETFPDAVAAHDEDALAEAIRAAARKLHQP